jgi:hypothetical protein
VTVLASALVLAVAFAAVGTAKIAAHPSMVDRAGHVGFGPSSYRAIGSLEVAGAVAVAVVYLVASGVHP